jgi:ketosteroid isomerase-like protein
MSQENVELVPVLAESLRNREVVARVASGAIDVELFDPEVEWDMSGMAGLMPSDTTGIYSGHEGVRTYWRQWLEAWGDLQYEVQDVLDAGDEVVALIRNSCFWGRHSGILTELPPFAMVFTFRNGKVVRFRAFPDHELAREAVGLGE